MIRAPVVEFEIVRIKQLLCVFAGVQALNQVLDLDEAAQHFEVNLLGASAVFHPHLVTQPAGYLSEVLNRSRRIDRRLQHVYLDVTHDLVDTPTDVVPRLLHRFLDFGLEVLVHQLGDLAVDHDAVVVAKKLPQPLQGRLLLVRLTHPVCTPKTSASVNLVTFEGNGRPFLVDAANALFDGDSMHRARRCTMQNVRCSAVLFRRYAVRVIDEIGEEARSRRRCNCVARP